MSPPWAVTFGLTRLFGTGSPLPETTGIRSFQQGVGTSFPLEIPVVFKRLQFPVGFLVPGAGTMALVFQPWEHCVVMPGS